MKTFPFLFESVTHGQADIFSISDYGALTSCFLFFVVHFKRLGLMKTKFQTSLARNLK